MNTINYLFSGYICFFAVLSIYLFRMDKKMKHMQQELNELQATKKS